MPELPEVETTKNILAPWVEGQRVKEIIVRNSHLRIPVGSEILRLKGRCIARVMRRAKYLVMELTGGGYLVIHLGMTGYFKILTKECPPGKHDHIDLVLQNGAILRFNDSRRFGSWQYGLTLASIPGFAALGVEPLSADLSVAYLQDKFKNKKTSIKVALMDRRIVVGVGNIYANEALFRAEIHPATPAKGMSQKELDRLIQEIRRVLKTAIAAGGCTIKDFKNPHGRMGYFAHDLYVYGKKGEPCRLCSAPIQKEKLSGRASFFCPNHQKLKKQADR